MKGRILLVSAALLLSTTACVQSQAQDNPVVPVLTTAPAGQVIVDHCYDTTNTANAMRCVSWRNTKGSDTTTIWFGPYSSFKSDEYHNGAVLV